MTPSPKALKGSEQCQDDCTGENFVRKRAVSQIDWKHWGIKRDLDRFYVNTVLQDYTALELRIDCTMKKREFSNNMEKNKFANVKIRPADEIKNDPFLIDSFVEN